MTKIDPLIVKFGLGRGGHAHYAPSSSYGWLNCPGFLLANAVMPDTAGVDAAYGTVAHGIAERWRRTGRPNALVGSVINVGPHAITVDHEMLDFVEQFMDWCDEIEGDAFVEQQVDLSAYLPIPNQGGTADHFVCAHGLLTITDLKMGTGVKVFVERNPQAMLYALGAFEEYDWIYGFQRIVIRICQPRLGYFGVWECSREDLIAFGEHVRERALLAWQADAPRIPGEKQCRFCRAKQTCPAISMHLDDLADDSFDAEGDVAYSAAEMAVYEVSERHAEPPTPGDPLRLSTEFLAHRLRYRRVYEKWFKTIYEEMLRRVQAGQDGHGWKLAQGRRSFEWLDKDEAVAALIEHGIPDDEVYETEVISVATARKKLRAARNKPKAIAEIFEGIVDAKDGKPTIVPVNDERGDLNAAVDDAFGTEDDD